MTEVDPKPTGKVLVVDDDQLVLRFYSRVLTGAGHEAVLVSNGQRAVELFHEERFDVVLCDINMPGMDGLRLLRALRECDLDVPVIMVTGEPSLATSMRALEYGAMRYLTKPIEDRLLLEVVVKALRLHRMADLKRQALQMMGGTDHQLGDRASLENAFERALRGLWLAYQPVVRWSTRSVFGYEALVRSDEPLLPTPSALFGAGQRLGRVTELGRVIRAGAAASAAQLPTGALLLVNLHPSELLDEEIYDAAAPLSRVAKRAVLEITERVSLETVDNVPGRVARLRQLGFGVAIDDLGAGFAGLANFAQLEPEIVKVDPSLVRHIEDEVMRQRIVQSIIELCRPMGMQVIAEGVETAAERDTLRSLGCDLMQGFFFSAPDREIRPIQNPVALAAD